MPALFLQTGDNATPRPPIRFGEVAGLVLPAGPSTPATGYASKAERVNGISIYIMHTKPAEAELIVAEIRALNEAPAGQEFAR